MGLHAAYLIGIAWPFLSLNGSPGNIYCKFPAGLCVIQRHISAVPGVGDEPGHMRNGSKMKVGSIQPHKKHAWGREEGLWPQGEDSDQVMGTREWDISSCEIWIMSTGLLCCSAISKW